MIRNYLIAMKSKKKSKFHMAILNIKVYNIKKLENWWQDLF